MARSLISNEIIDVETGQEITPPVDGALRAVTLRPDGGRWSVVDTAAGTEFVLLDADDHVVARAVESATEADVGEAGEDRWRRVRPRASLVA